MAFNPTSLTPAASLNRVCIVDLPGIPLESWLRGKTAGDLLSASALAADVRRHAAALGLAALQTMPDTDLLPAFAQCFSSPVGHVQASADAIARRCGQALGTLILTLKRGDPINRAARPEWDDTYWDHWARIQTIWLGGGRMTGRLGERVRAHAAAWLGQDAEHACTLQVATDPSLLPLIGAARSVPPATRLALLCDFGHSAIKRAYAAYDAGSLTRLYLLPSLAAAPSLRTPPGAPSIDTAQDVGARILDVLCTTWMDVQRRHGTASALVMSVANYVHQGHLLPRQGGLYAPLHTLPAGAARWLTDRLYDRVCCPVAVEILHDGSAAARTYAGRAQAAVIMMGTTLGVGFTPRALSLRPIDRHFAASPAPQGATHRRACTMAGCRASAGHRPA